MGTVEGYYASLIGWGAFPQAGVEMPLPPNVTVSVMKTSPLKVAIGELMARPRRHEIEAPWVGEE